MRCFNCALCHAIWLGNYLFKRLGTTSEKIKSKKRDFGPFSLYPYPPTIKRDILIWDIFYSIFPPTLLNKIGTFLNKKFTPQVHFHWLWVANLRIFGPCTRASNLILHFLILSWYFCSDTYLPLGPKSRFLLFIFSDVVPKQ